MTVFDARYSNATAEDDVTYWLRHKSTFGSATHAVASYNDPDAKGLVLRSDTGNVMFLGCCCVGFPGAGPEATIEILCDAGTFGEESGIRSRVEAAEAAHHPQVFVASETAEVA